MKIVWGLLAVAIAATASAQDAGRILREALDKASKTDGLGVRGTVKQADEAPKGPAGMVFGGMGGAPLEGELAAKLSEKEAELEVVNKEKNFSVEIFRRGEKTAKRMSWAHEHPMADFSIPQLVRLLDFDAIGHASRDGEFKDVEEETADGKTLQIIRGTLGEKLLARDDEERKGPMAFPGPKVKKIEFEGKLDKESGLPVSLSFTVTREMDLSGMKMRSFGPGGEMEPPDDNEEPKKIEMRSKVEYKVVGTGDEHKPKIPERMERLLKD